MIDSNKLRSLELRDFLILSPDHRAVLTDYAWMEAYKGDSVLAITQSMAILSEFPEQVVLLKGTKAVCAIDARAPGVAERMIWPGRDGRFSETVAGLKQAAEGNEQVVRAILQHGEAAKLQMDKLLADAPHILSALPGLQRLFAKHEIAAIRPRSSYSNGLAEKVFDAADYMAGNFFKRHPAKPRYPSRVSMKNTFLFRYSLGAILYLLEWIEGGSQTRMNSEQVRNDTVDITFATYATFFNGLLSGDKLATSLYLQMRILLNAAGARLSPDFFETLEPLQTNSAA